MKKEYIAKTYNGSVVLSREVLQNGNAVLFQTIICAISISFFLYTGDPRTAGISFWALFALFGIRAILLGKHLELVGLIIATAPIMNYLRGFVFYNVVVVVWAGGALLFFLSDSVKANDVVRQKPSSIVFLLLLAFYYFLTFVNTGSYWNGLRGLELGFALLLVLLLGNIRRDILSAALLGLFLSGVAIAIGFFPYISTYQNRLGIAVIDGYFLGNPITLGLPLALGLLGLVLNNGSWLNVNGRLVWRVVLLMTCVLFLALSTSRGSWLVAGGSLAFALAINSRRRFQVLVLLCFVAIILNILLNSPLGQGVNEWVDRTIPTAGTNTLSHITSGRTDQWKVGWYALNNGSLLNFFLGFGAGKGNSIYAQYSQLVAGIIYEVGGEQAWHSYFLQLAIETGFLGVGIFTIWLISIFYQAFRNLRLSNDVFPIACLIGYILITLTVSGNDTISGAFLGLSMLSGKSIFSNEAQDFGNGNPALSDTKGRTILPHHSRHQPSQWAKV